MAALDWNLGVKETSGIPPSMFFNGPIPEWRRQIIIRQQTELKRTLTAAKIVAEIAKSVTP